MPKMHYDWSYFIWEWLYKPKNKPHCWNVLPGFPMVTSYILGMITLEPGLCMNLHNNRLNIMGFFCDWVILYTNSIYGETKASMNYIIFFTLLKCNRKLHAPLWGITVEGVGDCALCNSNFVMADWTTEEGRRNIKWIK